MNLTHVADRMMTLLENDPMGEDEQTEFMELATFLASHLATPTVNERH